MQFSYCQGLDLFSEKYSSFINVIEIKKVLIYEQNGFN